jgi:metal-responsive CopG/Arc/MetJ family transcriptional regulator
MSTLKTAISIDKKTFIKVENLSKKLHLSRSQFFAQAARYMIEKDENLDLLKRINNAYTTDVDEKIHTSIAKDYLSRKVVERW